MIYMQNIYYDLVVEYVFGTLRTEKPTHFVNWKCRLQRVLHGILSARIIQNVRKVASDASGRPGVSSTSSSLRHGPGMMVMNIRREQAEEPDHGIELHPPRYAFQVYSI